MIERKHRYGNLVFDRDAIVRATLRAYVEAIVKHSRDGRLPLSFPVCDDPGWAGDLDTSMLELGSNHGEKLAGLGFWLHGDRVGGTFFDYPTSGGADRLAVWGLLRGGRLLPLIYLSSHPSTRATLAECARKEAPIHALMDAVVDRRLHGPTEFTSEEIAMLFPSPPDAERLLGAQRMLQKVGITWPGSPEIPEEPRRTGRNPFLAQS